MRRYVVIKEEFWHWLVRKLPKKLVYFCGVRVLVHSTTGKHSSTVVPDLTAIDALKRYGDDYNVYSHRRRSSD